MLHQYRLSPHHTTADPLVRFRNQTDLSRMSVIRLRPPSHASLPQGDGAKQRMDDFGSDARSEEQTATDIVFRIRTGERRAEEDLVARYRAGLVIMLRGRTRDPDLAEDLAQDALFRVLEKIRGDGLDEPERLAGYLHGIAVRMALGHSRKEARRDTVADTETVEQHAIIAGSVLDDIEAEELKRLIHQLLRELDLVPRDRRVLEGIYVLELTKEQICENEGIDRVHFSRVLYRAKDRFRKLVEAAGYSPILGGLR